MSPYRAILGEMFDTLHPNVRRAHEAPLAAKGAFDVVHGTHPLTPLLVSLMKLPAAGNHVPVALSLLPGPPGQLSLRWKRRIGGMVLETRQSAHQGLLIEEMGPGRMVFSLRAADGCLSYEHVGMRFLFLRLPRVFSPRVRARVSPDPQGWHAEVVVEWRGQLICRYGGAMRPLQVTS